MNRQPTIIESCPCCKNQLSIRVLECSECGLKLEGSFQKDPLLKLGAEDLNFVRLFIHCEGSIRDMERALGVSYPTVKARLAEVRSKLGAEPITRPSSQSENMNLLKKLEDGEMNFNDALNAIKGANHAGRT